MRSLTFAIVTAAGIVAGAACASRPPPPPRPPDPVQVCRDRCSKNCAEHESEWYPACAIGCDKQCERTGLAELMMTLDAGGGRWEGGGALRFLLTGPDAH